MERHGRQLRLLLAKNPAGWLEAFDVWSTAAGAGAARGQRPDADGTDTSWLWDVDYRRLRGRPVFVTGERQLDLAVRLEVDEVAFRMVGDIDEAIAAARRPAGSK